MADVLAQGERLEMRVAWRYGPLPDAGRAAAP